MTHLERLRADPRVISVERHPDGWLCGLAAGWRWPDGTAVAFKPDIRFLTSGLFNSKPDPESPPSLKFWSCDCPAFPPSIRHFRVAILDQVGRFIRVGLSRGLGHARWIDLTTALHFTPPHDTETSLPH